MSIPDRLKPAKSTVYVFVGHTITCATNTGVQRVVRGLSNALIVQGYDVKFVRWNSGSQACELITREERTYLGHWNGPAATPEDLEFYPGVGDPLVPIVSEDIDGGWLVCSEVTHMTGDGEPITLPLIKWAHEAGLKAGFVFYDAIPLKREEFAASVPIHSQYMRDLRQCDEVWPISYWSADELAAFWGAGGDADNTCLLYTSPSPRDGLLSRMPSSA